ncbi:DUF2892 domain-containing protein [Natrinema sp. 1APR25-10V2]|uniref:YgaP family membrane protein n=1 Tax=Natrinema sp. 1APR25-10V2 TaxID=2951081 RepID=UPI0028744225|nr:DUF2892 domain-containing protein [Natrinema sp. 1APR25-10V2]MDS0473374.1 DUF2892 domain-containing protein [Natrinema sp. 1APR25-10V2]
MKSNIGSADRMARLVVGAVLLAVGVATLAGVLEYGVAAGAIAAVVGVVALGTGLTRFCLLYRVLGVDTCDVS